MSIVTDVVGQGIETLKGVLTSRPARLKELADVEAKAAADERALKVRLDAAQAWVDELERPRKELARLQEEMYSHGIVTEQARGPLCRWLEANPTPELARFKALLDRLVDKIRTMDKPDAKLKTNFITSAQTITNLEELERWHVAVSGPPDPARPGRRLPSALKRAQTACVTELWRAPEGEQRIRIAELRAAIAESFKGMPLENELG